MEQACSENSEFILCGSCSHLSSLVLKPHLHHPNTEPRLGSQRLPHLQPPRQKVSSIPQENKVGTLKHFASFHIFQQTHCPFDFSERWMNAVVFLDLSVICLFKALARVQACFRAPATEAALLSQYDICCRRTALHQPSSVNTEQSAAPHFKAQL